MIVRTVLSKLFKYLSTCIYYNTPVSNTCIYIRKIFLAELPNSALREEEEGGGCFVLLKGRVLISHWLFWQFNIEFLKEEEEERLGFPLGKYCEIL